ncbi:MAG: VUT family protein [Reyranella sp.]|nr:VUT family protein [Reyranella sp.]MBN9091208.1 VUT family protein [Reyranella sp.]
MSLNARKAEGLAYFLAFMACIPLANWMIGHVGVSCVPGSGVPCLLPVLPWSPQGGPLMAPSGVLMIGIALVLRDLVQRRLGRVAALLAIVAGAVLSGAVAPPQLVLASTTAFFLSELADFAVYTPLQKRGLVIAVLASSVVGLIADSLLFLYLAFGSLEFLEGQIVGKTWMVLLALPIVQWIRTREGVGAVAD